MLQLKAEVEIRLFNVFFWERKRDSGFRRKKCGMRDFCEKGAGMRDHDPPSRPSLIILSSTTVIFLCFDKPQIKYNSQILACKQKQRCG